MKFIENLRKNISKVAGSSSNAYDRLPPVEDPTDSSNANNEEYIRAPQRLSVVQIDTKSRSVSGNTSPKYSSKPGAFASSPSGELADAGPSASGTRYGAEFNMEVGGSASGRNNSLMAQPLDDYYDDEDAISVLSREMTLKDRQESMNKTHLFGIRLWKPALYKKTRGIDRETDEALHSQPFASIPSSSMGWFLYPGNIMWLCLFGWWMALVYMAIGGLLQIILFSSNYPKLMFNMAGYILWPFGKYVEKVKAPNLERDVGEPRPSPSSKMASSNPSPLIPETESQQRRFSGIFNNQGQDVMTGMSIIVEKLRREQLSFADIVYYIFIFLTIVPMHFIVSCLCWFCVVSVPMAKLNWVLMEHLISSPKCIWAKTGRHFLNGDILLCTYKAIGLQYYKYTYDGINIILLNLVVFVVFALLDGYFLAPMLGNTGIGNPVVVFVMCILSIIPLAYYIGMAVSSISAQSSLGMAAVINATFGSIVEIILYALAIAQGKSNLVQGALIGSFLGAFLLLPGVSMIAGGIKKKQQRFNTKSTGVTSTLLIISMIGVFTPTFFYSIFGKFDMHCELCPDNGSSSNNDTAILGNNNHTNRANPVSFISDGTSFCQKCVYLPTNIYEDKVFLENVRPISYLCSIILPTVYIVGLWFTLRTHVSQIYENTASRKRESTFSVVSEDGDPSHSGHNAPNWGRTKSTAILLISTVLFSLLAEILLKTVDDVIAGANIDERYLGLTLFALAPNFTEFLNAIAFAMYGNIELSLEIGSAYTLQVALLQIPSLIAFSAFYNWNGVNDPKRAFELLFPRWDMIASLFGMVMLTYSYNEGKSNYFKGAVLTFVYIILIFSFAYVPEHSGLVML